MSQLTSVYLIGTVVGIGLKRKFDMLQEALPDTTSIKSANMYHPMLAEIVYNYASDEWIRERLEMVFPREQRDFMTILIHAEQDDRAIAWEVEQ